MRAVAAAGASVEQAWCLPRPPPYQLCDCGGRRAPRHANVVLKPMASLVAPDAM
jgi:hypothetical protein